jgi:CubicO group peptidase (beta-lactamase class C family)
MRRVLTFLTAIVLLLVSLGIGVFTADLPFWRRALQLPLSADGAYLPVAVIGLPAPRPLADAGGERSPLDAQLVEAAVMHARSAGSRALLVMYRGRLQLERYFTADDALTLMPAALVARPLAAMAIGIGINDRRIASLDVPIARYLPEWDDEARGRITLRQLLEETSGLETGGDTRHLLFRSPWDDVTRLPAFATRKGVRMLLGNDFESTALGFRLDHEPGGFYNVSPANPQLAAVIVERATGVPYEKYLDEHLWQPLGAGRAELQLDRGTGMPAAHCCWRATARDMLRVASLLATDGVFDARAVLPAGWVREMARPSRVNAETGLQITRDTLDGAEILSGTDDNGSAFWAIPARELAILNIVSPGGGTAPELPTLLLRALGPG